MSPSPINGVNGNNQTRINRNSQINNSENRKKNSESIFDEAKSEKESFKECLQESIKNYLSSSPMYAMNDKGQLVAQKTKSIFAAMWTSFKENAKWAGKKLNHAINYFNQGGEGNCGLLAAIQAVGERPDSKKILKETIKESPDGNGYQVRFKGAKNKPVFISKSAVMSDSMYRRNPNSDLETIILNQAAKKVMGPPPYYPQRALELLTGEKAISIRPSDLSKLSPLQINSLVGCWANHAWSIQDIKNGKYILRNPHNTSRTETQSGSPWGLYTTVKRSLTA